MCLIALALDQDRRFPLILAANRDEYFDRPTARLAWWAPDAGAPEILSGRDLHAGGTWLGLTAAGRLAFVTNIRRPQEHDANAVSRGSIVPLWLRGDLSADRFWMQVALSGHNPFNVVAADFRRGECYWATSDASAPRRLDRGLYGLSNAALDTPWPKVEAVKQRVREALVGVDSVSSLSTRLFAAMADRSVAPDESLPRTGVPIEWERQLSSAFVCSEDQNYGTRSTTLIITERVNKRLVTHVLERSFPAGGGLALLRQSSLKDWPPKYSEGETVAAQTEVVSEAEFGDTEPLATRRTRVRSLLKPEPKRRRFAPTTP
jgi:uncharacterized protein with NRDE domain